MLLIYHQHRQLSCCSNFIPTFNAIPWRPSYARTLTPIASSMTPITIGSPKWGKAVTFDGRLLILTMTGVYNPFKRIEAPTWELPSLFMSLNSHTRRLCHLPPIPIFHNLFKILHSQTTNSLTFLPYTFFSPLILLINTLDLIMVHYINHLVYSTKSSSGLT